MSSTEQKNITQPFIDCCYTYGILPTIVCGRFDNFSLATGGAPFVGLGETPNLGRRLRGSVDPIAEAQRLLPVLRNARPTTRFSPLLLRLCTDANVYSGNQGVCRLYESLCIHRWGVHSMETKAYRHARKHACKIAAYLAPGSYSSAGRTESNYSRLEYQREAGYLRSAADTVDYISKSTGGQRYTKGIRRWCADNREASGFRPNYIRRQHAIEDLRSFDPKCIHECTPPPSSTIKWLTVKRAFGYSLQLYFCGPQTIVKVTHLQYAKRASSLYAQGRTTPIQYEGSGRTARQAHEVYIFNKRDLADLQFLLQTAAHVRTYCRRKLYDIKDLSLRVRVRSFQENMWNLYLLVARTCGADWQVRNKLGVYFDVLQWRYLAWRSGDKFYNHSRIMANKVTSKGLQSLPSQDLILQNLRNVPMDIAIDMLGIYKASIYPEVDPFDVVVQQRSLHFSRFNTDWGEGTPERLRFLDTKAYMWYFGIRVLYQHNHVWPGRIREGVAHRGWHRGYSKHGIPSDCWRQAHDVDLSGAVPVSDISNEQYVRQQDSACAPPHHYQYGDYESLAKAPRRHRRKLLYAIQETSLPDLPDILNHLNQLGRSIPDEYVDELKHDLPFSTHIVTGSRCERHKDAPRPFYVASPPWGCVLSYFDGITRDFLQRVPQSMLGKSTKQKYTDLMSVSRTSVHSVRNFYMSDDKAKYSPRMDPRSQQLPAEFFAEMFNIPGMRAFGPIMYHSELFYRVCGHLVHYNSNGTDREGMRGASNTWLEVVAQGLTTRLSRDANVVKGKSVFLSFIDDGLRRFSIDTYQRSEDDIMKCAQAAIDDVVFGLRVLGRELSWDKTFISTDLYVMLNEIIYDGTHFTSGLKSFCTAGDVELKEVMTAPDYEQLYFGKMRGAHGVGAPLDLCHYVYLFETLMSHYSMGAVLQNNHRCNSYEYHLYCITPVALGGVGMRSILQLSCNEVANATKEGIGNLIRAGQVFPYVLSCTEAILNQPMALLSPVDFMREPEQFHVAGPRLKTQRLAAEVRKQLRNIASNELSRRYVQQDEQGMEILKRMGRTMMATGDVSAEEIRLLYSCTPVAFLDEFIQKLASSTTLSEILDRTRIAAIRRMVRRDLVASMDYFHVRCLGRQVLKAYAQVPEMRPFVLDLLQ